MTTAVLGAATADLTLSLGIRVLGCDPGRAVCPSLVSGAWPAWSSSRASSRSWASWPCSGICATRGTRTSSEPPSCSREISASTPRFALAFSACGLVAAATQLHGPTSLAPALIVWGALLVRRAARADALLRARCARRACHGGTPDGRVAGRAQAGRVGALARLRRRAVRSPATSGASRPASAWASCRVACSPTPRPAWCAASARPDARSTSTSSDGEAVNVSPSVDYSGQPRAWRAPRAGKPSRRCARPTGRRRRSCETRPDASSPSTGRRRSTSSSIADEGDPGQARAGVGRLPGHGPDADARSSRSSARSAKFGMGMLHGDGNTRQCMATAVVAYKEAFGFDAPPYTYADFEESDVLVFVGANPCIAHPIMWGRVCKNPHRPDHRRRRSAPHRDRDGGDRSPGPGARSRTSSLLYGVARVLIERGWVDRAVHRRAHQRLRRLRRARRARSRSTACPPRRARARGRSSASRALIHRGQARLVLVDDGRQPEPRRRAPSRRRSSRSRS